MVWKTRKARELVEKVDKSPTHLSTKTCHCSSNYLPFLVSFNVTMLNKLKINLLYAFLKKQGCQVNFSAFSHIFLWEYWKNARVSKEFAPLLTAKGDKTDAHSCIPAFLGCQKRKF